MCSQTTSLSWVFIVFLCACVSFLVCVCVCVCVCVSFLSLFPDRKLQKRQLCLSLLQMLYNPAKPNKEKVLKTKIKKKNRGATRRSLGVRQCRLLCLAVKAQRRFERDKAEEESLFCGGGGCGMGNRKKNKNKKKNRLYNVRPVRLFSFCVFQNKKVKPSKPCGLQILLHEISPSEPRLREDYRQHTWGPRTEVRHSIHVWRDKPRGEPARHLKDPAHACTRFSFSHDDGVAFKLRPPPH